MFCCLPDAIIRLEQDLARIEALDDAAILCGNNGDQHAIYLPVWTDHVIRAADIDELFLLIEGNSPGISLPDAQPDVTTLKLPCGLMN